MLNPNLKIQIGIFFYSFSSGSRIAATAFPDKKKNLFLYQSRMIFYYF